MSEALHATLSAAGIIIFMVLIFFGAHYAAKLVGRGSMRVQGKGGQLEILGRTMLGREQALVVVRVGEKALLLGVTAQQITKLEELDPTQFTDAEQVPENSDFFRALKDAWQQNKRTNGKEDRHP